MRKLCFLLFIIFSMATGARESFAQEKLFVDSKCNRCHAVSAYGIEIKKSGDDEEDEEEENVKVPDLSDVGKFREVDYLKRYLKKEITATARDGKPSTKKHKVKFNGSDQEFDQLVAWLVTLKKDPTK